MKFFVTVKLKAKQAAVKETAENSFEISVNAPPIEGRANEAVINALSKHLKIPKSRIEIISGRNSRRKVLEIKGADKMPLEQKRFRVLNEEFRCANCGRAVLPTTCGTPRNHCPFCLYCLHADINVGDRSNPCRGIMKPVGAFINSKKGVVVVHECLKCGLTTRAKAIRQGVQPDDFDLIVRLSANPANV